MQCKKKDPAKQDKILRARIEELEGQILDLESTIHKNEARSNRHKDELLYKIAALEKTNYELGTQLQITQEDNEKLKDELKNKDTQLQTIIDNKNDTINEIKIPKKEIQEVKDLSLLDDLDLTMSDGDDDDDDDDTDISLDLPDDSRVKLSKLRTNSDLSESAALFSEKIQTLERSEISLRDKIGRLEESRKSLEGTMAEMTSENAELKSEKSIADNQIKDLEATKDLMKKVISDQVAETKNISADTEKQMQQKMADLHMSESTMRNVIADLQVSDGQLKARVSTISLENDDLKENCVAAQKQLRENEEKMKQLQEDLDRYKTDENSSGDNTVDQNKIKELEDVTKSLEAELTKCTARIQELEKEADESTEQVKHLEDSIKLLEQEVEVERKQVKELENELQKTNDELVALKSKEDANQHQSDLETRDHRIEELLGVESDLRKGLETKDERIKQLQETEVSLIQEIELKGQTITDMKEIESNLKENCAKKDTQIKSIQDELESKEQQIQDLLDNKSTLKQELDNVREQCTNYDQLQQENEACKNHIEDLEYKEQELQQELAELQQALTYNQENSNELESSKEHIAELENQQRKLTEELEELQGIKEQYQDGQARIDELEKEVCTLENRKQTLSNELSRSQQREAESSQAIEQNNAVQEELEELREYKQTETEELNKLKQLKQDYEKQMSQLMEENEMKEELENNIEQLKQDLSENQQNLKTKADLMVEMREALSQKQQDMEALREELEQKMEMMQEELSESFSDKRLALENEISELHKELESINQNDTSNNSKLTEELKQEADKVVELEIVVKDLKDDVNQQKQQFQEVEQKLKSDVQSLLQQYSDGSLRNITLQDEKAALEGKLHGVEEMLKEIGEFEGEAVLREKIADLEQSERALKRQVKHLEMTEAEEKEAYEKMDEEAQATEKSYQEKVAELQQTEAELTEKVAQLESSEDHWKQEAVAFEDRVRELDEIRSELRGRVSRAEEEVEELQMTGRMSTMQSMHSSIAEDELSLFRELDTQPISEESEDDVESIGNDDKDDEMELLKEEVSILKESEEMLKEELSTKEKELDDLKKHEMKELDALKITNSNLEKSEMDLIEQVQTLETELNEKDNCIDELEGQVKTLEDMNGKIRQLECSNDQLTKELEMVKDEKAKILQDKVKLEEEICKLMSEQDDNVDKVGDSGPVLDQERNIELEKTLAQTIAALEGKTSRCKKLEAKIGEMELALVDVMSTNKDVEDECNRLQDTVEDLQKSEFELMEKVVSLDDDNTDDDESSLQMDRNIPVVSVTPASPRSGDEDRIKELQKRIQELEAQEEVYQQQIYDLQERQLAFEETLAQADTIMSGREQNLQERIGELENSQSDLKEQLDQTKEAENSWRLTTSMSSMGDDTEEFTSVFETTDKYLPERKDGKDDDSVMEASTGFSPDDKQSDYAMHIQALEYNVAQLEENEHQINAELDDSRSHRDSLEIENAQLQERMSEMKSKMASNLDNEPQGDQNDKSEENSHMKSEMMQMAAEMAQMKSEMLEMTTEIVDLKALVVELKSREFGSKELTSQCEELTDDKDNLTVLNGDLQTEIDDLNDTIEQLQQDLTKANQQTCMLKANLNPNRKLSFLQSSEPTDLHLKHQVADLETELAELNEQHDHKLEEAEAETLEYRKKVEVLQVAKDALEEKLAKQEGLLNNLQKGCGEDIKSPSRSTLDLEDTVYELEASIEFLTEKLQDSEDRETSLQDKLEIIEEQSDRAVRDTNSLLEKRLMELAASEEKYRIRVQDLEAVETDLKRKLNDSHTEQDKSQNQSSDLEIASKELQKQLRAVEDTTKSLRLDNSQLKHEKDLLNEKVSALKSSESVLQRRLEEVEESDSKLRIQLKGAVEKEAGFKEQIVGLQDDVKTSKSKSPSVVEMEHELYILQEELQKACSKMEELKQSKNAAEEQLKKMQDSLHKDHMVKIPQLEYQQLKAQARLLDMTDDPNMTASGQSTLKIQLQETSQELKQLKEESNEKERAYRELKDNYSRLHNEMSTIKSGKGENGNKPSGENAQQTNKHDKPMYPVFEIPPDCLTSSIDLGGSLVTLEELLFSLDSPDYSSFHVTPDIDDIDMHPVKEEKNFFVHFGPRQRKPGLARKRVIQQLVKNLPEIKKKKRSIFGVKNKPKVPKVPKKPQDPVDEEPAERQYEEDEILSRRPIDAASPDRRRKLVGDVVNNLPDLFYDVSDVEALYAKLPRHEEVSSSSRPVEEAIILETSLKPAHSLPEHGGYDSSRASSIEPPMLPGSSLPTRPMLRRDESFSDDSLPTKPMLRRDSSFSDDSLSVISDCPPPLPSGPPPSFPHHPSSFPQSFSSDPNISPFHQPFHSRTSSFESDELNHPSVFIPSMSADPITPTNSNQVFGAPSFTQPDTPTNATQGFGPPFLGEPITPTNANRGFGPPSFSNPITPTSANQDYAPPSLLHPPMNRSQRPPSFDSGTSTISTTATEHEADAGMPLPEQNLQLPETPQRTSAAPLPLPKPETPLWLKKMMDWQHTEKEKELSDLKKLKVRLHQLQTQDQEKDDQIRELKQREQEMRRKLWHGEEARRIQNKLQVKELELEDKERTVARQTSDVKSKEREIARLETRLEQSQDKLAQSEQKLKEIDTEESKAKGQLDQKEHALESKMDELQRQNSQVNHLREELNKLRQDDAAKMSQIMELSAKVDTLTKENAALREKNREITSLEEHCAKLQNQVADSRMSEREKRALQCKLQLAENMLRQKTAQELRLTEDNAILEDRVQRMENQGRNRDGIEEDYRNIKEQFDEMEHQKHEAELAVAPLKAKLSYLTQKCKEKDAALQAVAMDIRKTNPEKGERLLSDISSLHSLLPREAANQPLSTQPRVRGRPSRSNRRVLDPVTEEEAIYSGIREDNGPGSSGRRSRRHHGSKMPLSSVLDDLDLAGDVSLDFGEISVRDLIDQTSRTAGRRPLRYEDGDDEDDLVASVVGDTMSRIRHGLRERGTYLDDTDDTSRNIHSRRQPRERRHKIPESLLRGSPEEILQLHRDLEEAHIPNYELPLSESVTLPNDINLNNLHLEDIPQEMPTSIGLSLQSPSTGQPSLGLLTLGGQPSTMQGVSGTIPPLSSDVNWSRQPSNSRSVNNIHQLLSNGLPTTSSSVVNTITAPNGTRLTQSDLHGNQNGHGNPATMIPSVRNSTSLIGPLNYPAGTPQMRVSSLPSQRIPSHAAGVHVGNPASNSLPFTSQQDFAIPRANIFQSVPRTETNNATHLPTQNGHFNIQSTSHGALPQQTMPHQLNGIHTPYSNNPTTVPLMSSAPSRNVPSVEVTPSVAPYRGVPNVGPSTGLPVGVDMPDYNGINGGRSQHSGTLDPPLNLTVSKVIGRHGILLTWKPPIMDEMGQNQGKEIVGYKIYVDGKQKQFVTNAHLTKAVVDGIDPHKVKRLGIQSVSITGQSSIVKETHFDETGTMSSSLSESVASESVHEASTEASSVVSEEPQERLFMAVYTYKPSQHSPNDYPTYELSFEEGDIIRVYGQMRADGFYQGKVHGRKGLVPSNFIEEIFMSSSLLKKKKHSKSGKNRSKDKHSSLPRKERHQRESKESQSYSKKQTTNKENRSKQKRDIYSQV